MLKLMRDGSGHLVVESLNGTKLVIQEFENGFKFKSKWWPRKEAHKLVIAIEQELALNSY